MVVIQSGSHNNDNWEDGYNDAMEIAIIGMEVFFES